MPLPVHPSFLGEFQSSGVLPYVDGCVSARALSHFRQNDRQSEPKRCRQPHKNCCPDIFAAPRTFTAGTGNSNTESSTFCTRT
eukprot:COSAG02_NODE_393_length_23190_cov_56.721926_14_plen_83_part_00